MAEPLEKSMILNNLILLISGLILSTVASYTAYHIESDGYILAAILIYTIFYIPVLVALINLFDIISNIAKNEEQRNIIRLSFILCVAAVVFRITGVILPAIIRMIDEIQKV